MARESIAAMLLVCIVAGAVSGQSKVYEPHNTTAILQITFAQDEGLMSSGSCVAVDAYHVLTAAHVVGSSTATIKAKGGDVKAKVVAIDFFHDRALLRAAGKLTEKARKLREDMPKEGEPLFAIGFGGRGFGFTRCSAAGGKIRGRSIPGDSGGPVCDKEGRIVGLITGYSDDGWLMSPSRKGLVKWVRDNIGNDPMDIGP